jgi:hypothetical protein
LELLEDRTLLSTWYVNSLATGSNNGQSWANAYTDLQSALTSSQLDSGDQIWVARGTYKPTSGTDRTISFVLKDGVQVYGGFAGTETDLGQRDWLHNPTTLSGDIGEPDTHGAGSFDNTYTVVVSSGLTATAILDGFTITEGNANNDNVDQGAGMVNAFSSPTLRNLYFFNNRADYVGGGMYNVSSSPTLTNVDFDENHAGSDGGGMENFQSSPTLTNVDFSLNDANIKGGAISNDYYSSPKLTNVTFRINTANQGGGLANMDHSSPTLTNVTSNSNSAVYGNEPSGWGAFIYNENNSHPMLINSILWGDNGPEIYNHDSSSLAAVVFSDVQGDGTGLGNINADPLFVDAAHGNLHLERGSPAIDTGTNIVPPWFIVPSFDRDNNPRPVDGGTGRGAITDMGAYEFRPIIYVNAAAAAGGNGTSWATAYTDLQQALAAAAATEAIWVAQGTYKPTKPTDPTDPRTATFALKDGVAVYGGFAGTETQLGQRDWAQHVTTLSGDIGTPDDSSDNSYHVVTSSFLDASAILDGFTITAGNANGGSFPQFRPALDNGGGLYNDHSSPTLRNLDFFRNSAFYYGGGMYNLNSSPSLTNVNVRLNSSVGGHGGGLYNDHSSPTLTHVNIVQNDAYQGLGGGMFNDYSSPRLTSVGFNLNAAIYGGGLYNEHSSPTLTSVSFDTNYAIHGGGGGMSNDYSSPMLTNVTFSSNSASSETFGGGGLYNYESSPMLTNVTFSSNSSLSGGGLYNVGSSPTLTNCILWGDSGGEIFNYYSSVTVSYSDVQGGWSGTGIFDAGNNINTDPLFVDAAQGDLHLRRGSPAIDTGTNEFLSPQGTNLVRSFDLDGNSRPVDGGTGRGAITDMGAYEFLRPIIYVNAAAAAGGNGNSWATAYTDLQQALAAAAATEAIWVAQGTYKPTKATAPTDPRTATFALKDGVAVYGGFTGTETQLGQRDWVHHVTTLSGDIGTPDDSSDNSYHVVTSSFLDASAILDGFTITAGNANGGSDPSPALSQGGGMYNLNSSPTLRNLDFFRNSAFYDGGGMYNYYSSPTLTNVNVQLNSSVRGFGGGIFNGYYSSPTLTGVSISQNDAYQGFGGGMFNVPTSLPTLTDVTFGHNAAELGGGMYNDPDSLPTLTNVSFDYNTASEIGGGMYNLNSSPTLTNVTFSRNHAEKIGGGMYNDSSSPTLTNVTFGSNSSPFGGGIYNVVNSSPTLTNSILWEDSGGEFFFDSSSSATVTYSDVQGGWSDTGNINADPLFVDAAQGDLHLRRGSPAIDYGTNRGAPFFDRDNNPRPVDGGTGRGAITDMGAYEWFVRATMPTPSNAMATFASVDQGVTLSATVSPNNSTGQVTEGSVTFSVYSDPDHHYQVGSSVSGNVDSNGNASATYILPGGSVVGTYYIVAQYSGSADFTGSSASGSVTVSPRDVSSQVSVTGSGLVYNRSTQLFGGTMTLTNNGTSALNFSFEVVLTNLPTGVALANATGYTADGNPYILVNLPGGGLAPGQSVNFTVLFSNPNRKLLQYGAMIFNE